MKVVLFCGGKGLRLREYGDVPKPMVPIGFRPILWHIMKYYAHFGHTDFVLCLGYRADAVKEYFLSYRETDSNDLVLSRGGRRISLLSSDLEDWRIAFVDTGMQANIGQRLLAVRAHLAGEETFLASYGDGLTDAPLNEFIDDFARRDRVASFLSVRPNYPVHIVTQGQGRTVTGLQLVGSSGLRINGGYFILRQEIFNYMEPGDELVVEPFARLIKERRLMTYPYQGFWAPMDTLREHQELEELYEAGQSPWTLWRNQEPLVDAAERSRRCSA